MYQFSSHGILALVAVAMCWSLAAVLFRVGATGSVARKLSLLLVVEGATLISTGYLDLFLTEPTRALPFYPTFFRAEEIIHTVGDCAMLALYPPFLAAALRTKLTRPFSSVRVRSVLGVAALTLCAVVLWGPLILGGTLLYVLLFVLFSYATVSSVHAWHTACRSTHLLRHPQVTAFRYRPANSLDSQTIDSGSSISRGLLSGH